MGLRRFAGVAVAAAVVSGAGLLLSSPTSAVTPPTPITLDALGMSSSSCPVPPLGVYGSIAVKPATTVQFEPGVTLKLGQSMTLAVLSEAKTTPAPVAKTYAVPASGVKVPFASAGTYALDWKVNGLLGVAGFEQHGKLIVASSVQGCAVAVQVPVPNVSASAVPSPITSAINGGVSAVVSGVNGALSPVNSALPTLPSGAPTLPPIPGVPSLPGVHLPGASPTPGPAVPATNYKPTGPTVADRTVPKGYGNGSGLGGASVSVAGNPINAPARQSAAGTGNGTRPSNAGGSTVAPKRAGGAPKTVELASNRPHSALGALPTLAVILAVLALSGATAFYARTFLLQPAAAESKS